MNVFHALSALSDLVVAGNIDNQAGNVCDGKAIGYCFQALQPAQNSAHNPQPDRAQKQEQSARGARQAINPGPSRQADCWPSSLVGASAKGTREHKIRIT